jgi:hypothetical protein
MTNCPKCGMPTLTLAAVAAVSFTPYDTPEGVMILPQWCRLRGRGLSQMRYVCDACGETAELEMRPRWGGGRLVESIQRYPEYVRRLADPIPIQHEEPKPDPYRVGEEHHLGYTILIYDFQTVRDPMAYSVVSGDVTATPRKVIRYGGRFATYAQAKVAAMAAIDNIA